MRQLQDETATSCPGELQGVPISSKCFGSFPWTLLTGICHFVSFGFQYKDLLICSNELVGFDFRDSMRKQTGNLGERKTVE